MQDGVGAQVLHCLRDRVVFHRVSAKMLVETQARRKLTPKELAEILAALAIVRRDGVHIDTCQNIAQMPEAKAGAVKAVKAREELKFLLALCEGVPKQVEAVDDLG